MLSTNDVTRKPKTKPAKTEDGVATGMLITLAESVALAGAEPVRVPAGTLITHAICGGYSGRLRCNYSGHSMGSMSVNYRC